MNFATIQLATARVLRDNPKLRTVDQREKVWLLIKQSIPNAKFSTVERCIRKLQNQMGLYPAIKEDNRYLVETEYRSYFGGGPPLSFPLTE